MCQVRRPINISVRQSDIRGFGQPNVDVQSVTTFVADGTND